MVPKNPPISVVHRSYYNLFIYFSDKYNVSNNNNVILILIVFL